MFVVFKEMFAYKHPTCFSWLLLAKAALGAWFNVQNGVQEYFKPLCLFVFCLNLCGGIFSPDKHRNGVSCLCNVALLQSGFRPVCCPAPLFSCAFELRVQGGRQACEFCRMLFAIKASVLEGCQLRCNEQLPAAAPLPRSPPRQMGGEIIALQLAQMRVAHLMKAI